MVTPTTVVSVRGLRGAARAALKCSPDFVYVGRACAGWPASVWGNPFVVGMPRISAWDILVGVAGSAPLSRLRIVGALGALTPADALSCYDQWLHLRADLVALLPTLRGKRLGCWCGTWKPGEPEINCHAAVLANLADAGRVAE